MITQLSQHNFVQIHSTHAKIVSTNWLIGPRTKSFPYLVATDILAPCKIGIPNDTRAPLPQYPDSCYATLQTNTRGLEDSLDLGFKRELFIAPILFNRSLVERIY